MDNAVLRISRIVMRLALGVNVANGSITYKAVARDLGYEYVSVEDAFQTVTAG